jgi:hypothetical protein
MSAFLYGQLTARREVSAAGKSVSTAPPGMKTYIDALVALVPAEVLAAAAVFSTAFTNSTQDTAHMATVVSTDKDSLKLAFFGLVILAPALYLLGHTKGFTNLSSLERTDAVRMLIPSAAFIAWAMAQRPSPLFDAAVSISDGHKLLVIVFGSVILGAIAQILGIAADKKVPPHER